MAGRPAAVLLPASIVHAASDLRGPHTVRA